MVCMASYLLFVTPNYIFTQKLKCFYLSRSHVVVNGNQYSSAAEMDFIIHNKQISMGFPVKSRLVLARYK